jgi:hypothetical protein
LAGLDAVPFSMAFRSFCNKSFFLAVGIAVKNYGIIIEYFIGVCPAAENFYTLEKSQDD